MPQLTVACPQGQGPGQRGGGAGACRWMEAVGEDGDEAPVKRSPELQRSSQTPADVQPHRLLRPLAPWRRWHSVAPACVLWSVCRSDAPLSPSSFALDVCVRLLLVCLLWMVAGGIALALKHGLKPGQNQFRGERPRSSKQEVAAENRPRQCSQGSSSWGSDQPPPLAVSVADCLLLCVLQEPLPEPSVAHIQALLCRLESVSHALGKAATGPEAAPDGPDRDSALEHKVQAVVRYLEQRTASLRALIREQRDLEAGVKDMLGGLGGLWTQLEELHTGVTLTKEAGRGYRDLASAQTDAKTLFSVSAHYRNQLESCQANLKACTERLQELMWSHAHTSSSVSSSGESRWPELLLQSNIEQFDKVQESFLSLQQQTWTFQAHLEGLGPGSQEAQEAQAAEARSATAPCSSQSPHQHTSASVDAAAETLSFCERSALQLSSTIKHLRKPGKRK